MNKIKDLICSIKMLNEGQIFIKGGGGQRWDAVEARTLFPTVQNKYKK